MEPAIQTSLRRMLRMYLEQDPDYHRAARLAKDNSRGGLWLIGGSVFRTLAYFMYGTPMKQKIDHDFMVDSMPESFTHPGWTFTQNRYGNPKFVYKDSVVDLVPISRASSVVRRKVEPTIENFLDGAPFTIQKIALNCLDWRLVDRGGIAALMKQEVRVNDPAEADLLSQKKGRPIFEIMLQLAVELQFKIVK